MESLFGKKKERRPGGTLVLYTTKHGATQRYAERIAQPLDALVKEAAYAKADQAKTYDAIVLGCPVYAGKLKGLDFLADNLPTLKDKRLVIFTCGLYDPAQEDVRANLDEQIQAALGEAADCVSVFHLRGAIRWSSLGLMERMLMKALISQIRKKDEAARSETERLMLEAEGGALDFSDEADLDAIVRAARGGGEADA
ncbi:MAG: flavodoxin domain-containing protein [Candidatus Ventricola sp.]